ncbi:MAG TPA: WHG domain-containing protein [Spirochaetia bacterium]|nr:WHG domain-containing protein [Spirochaetia bacterium]
MAYFAYARRRPELYRLQLSLSLAPAQSAGARAVRPLIDRQTGIVVEMMRAISAQHGNVRKHATRAAAMFIGVINAQIGLF